jgi:hypothetical protein
MERGFDITFPNIPLTGKERTLAQPIQPDERSVGYRYKPSGALIEELPRFRNDMAHPESLNRMTVPQSPLSAYELLIDIIARLWPKSP